MSPWSRSASRHPKPMQTRILAHHALVLFVLVALSALGSCGEDKPEKGTSFTLGSHAQRGVEVLNPQDPGLPFYYSFGTIPYGDRYLHSFDLRNLEDVPVTILRTEPACSCSRVKNIEAWTGKTREEGTRAGDLSARGNMLRVEPGETFSVDILVDTLRVNPNAAKVAVLRVYTDSKVDPFLTFELHFLPEKLFELASPSLSLGDIPLGGGVGNTLQIWARVSENQVRLVDVESVSEGLEAELVLIPGFESQWNLSVTAVGQERKGPLRGKVILRTTNSMGLGDEGRLEIPVEGRVVEPVMMYPNNLSFGRLEVGKPGSLHAGVQGLAPGHRIRVAGARVEGPSAPHLDVRLEPIAEDSFGRCARVDVHVDCKAGAPLGPIDATLTLEMPEEAQGNIVRPITGLVAEPPNAQGE
ncbi:MAG: hypothetical protein KDB61_08320 [Planctomycetes bacterium]|nr:hypothetical protein [Planctomycetota bacterium]